MKKIGQVVRVDSALDWLVEVFREGDIERPPDREDYSVGTFLKVRAQRSKLVSIVRDVVIYNPEYGTPRVKAEGREEIEKLMPDLGDQVKTLIFVYYLGKLSQKSTDHTFPDLTPRLHDEARVMKDQEIRQFHTKEGSLYLGYLPRFLKVENAPFLFSKMADKVEDVLEVDKNLLRKIRNDVTMETKIGRIRGG